MEALCGPATHILLHGGSRSGKTFLIIRSIVVRALAESASRHLVARYRFAHIKSAIVYDTFPSVMEICFPEIPRAHERSGNGWFLDKSDWFVTLPNGSEIWFGGLDEKERTEKILGNEYASIFANECSQIPWSSRKLLVTRLAQKTKQLRLRFYYDENPPGKGHWTYKLFMQKRDPETRKPVDNDDNYTAYGPMNPEGNKANIAREYLDELKALPARERKRFYEGLFGDENDNALWTLECIEQQRYPKPTLPDMQRIVIAVDPSGTKGDEDKRSDEVGIVVSAIGSDGFGYVLEDLSGRMAPAEWGKVVVEAYLRHDADCIVAEVNFGGAMVEEIIRSAAAAEGIPKPPYREVRASRGKVVRAEPVAALFEQGKVWFDGNFPELEDQLQGLTTAGYTGDRSPDRADAMVWGLTYLFPGITRRQSEFRRREPRVKLGYQKTKAWA